MLPTPEQLDLLRPLFDDPPAPGARGRPPHHDLDILPAVLWKLSTAAPWEALPAEFPSPKTCYRRYRQWQRSGLLRRILALLLNDLENRGGFPLLQAHQQGLFTIRQRGVTWEVHFAPSHRDTWQAATARIFLGFVLKTLRRCTEPKIKTPTSPAAALETAPDLLLLMDLPPQSASPEIGEYNHPVTAAPRLFITFSYQGDRNRPEIERLCALVRQAGFADFCFVRDVEDYQPVFDDPAVLMQRALQEIEASDYLLLDLSARPDGAPTGRLYEAGIAYALGVKVIVIARRGIPLKDTTRGIAAAVIEYDQLEDIVEPLSRLVE